MKLFIFITMMLFNNTGDTCLQKEDTVVIKNYYKIVEHGHFYFLIKSKNSTLKQIIFSYDIDISKKQKHIVLIKEDNVNSVKNIKSYMVSKKWNNKQINTFKEKYFKVIDENFLKMTNTEKICLLKELAK